MAMGPGADLGQRPDDLEEGTQIGRYRIADIVGRGGMGTVYRAHDPETNREVAIKVLAADLPKTLKERFLAECEAEAKIRHAHVMPVYDRGTFGDGRLYFVMELVYEPITLSDIVEANLKGALGATWPRLRHWGSTKRLVQDVFIPICMGVHAANVDFGILHRDLKPDNVLIDVRTRRPTLIDFGVCHELGQPVESGKIMGTPRFLSPEQAVAKVDPRTDVWGLGALFFYVLAGRPPMEPSSPMRRDERDRRIASLKAEEEAAHAAGDENRGAELGARRAALEDAQFRTLDDMLADARAGRYVALPDAVPQAARAIVTKAMAKEPADRYENAGAFAADLRAWITDEKVLALAEQDATGAAVALAGRTVRRHLVSALLVVAGLVVGIPLGAKFLRGTDPATQEQQNEVRADAVALTAEAEAVAAMSGHSVEAALAWRSLRARVSDLDVRVAGLAEGDERDEAARLAAALRTRTAPPRLRIDGGGARTWAVESLLDRRVTPVDPTATPLPPGPYWLKTGASAGVRIPLFLPAALVPPGGTAPVLAVDLTLPEGRWPDGMVYVPPGPAEADGTEIPGFLIQTAEVTYFEYAEWLDELPEDERPAHLPARGFVEDRNRPGVFLVDPELESAPVVGVRPRDAAAFAAWRAELYGAAISLPTEEQWRRAAGGALLDPAYAPFFQAPHVDERRRLRRDRSPYGAEGLLTTPAEIVGTGVSYALAGGGAGYASSPSERTLSQIERVDPDRIVEAGFRLVRAVR